MNHKSIHTKFDSLRSGLHVEDVDFKDSSTPKWIDRENAYWQRIVDALEESANNDRPLCNQLRIRRREVLSGRRSKEKHRGLPRFAVGVAAGAVLFLTITMVWSPAPNQPGADLTRTASLRSAEREHAEFANNIDFYTWLEKQSDTVADAGGN